jgi:two-component system OmpR family sensor kinase
VTLRTRLLLALVALTMIGLAVAGAVTYRQQQRFLMQRVDQQLADVAYPMQAALESSSRAAPAGATHGTYGELRDADGVRITEEGVVEPPKRALIPPDLPDSLIVNRPRWFTAHAPDSGTHYRVLATPVQARFFSDARILVVAVPLTDVDQTLRHLFVVELLVAACVLGALALLAWWVVRLGLRPLQQMGETAGAIAAGDLSRRVEPANEYSEVGRLGLALNSMLGQIEQAFAERTASEARLRRFVADASHELRTPLTSIRGYAELFRRGANARPDDLAKAMQRIEEAAARMGVLVEDLLLLARLDQGRPLEYAPLDLARVAGAAVDDLRVTSPDRPVTFEASGPVMVNGDENRLRQVLANLLENARTHTPPATPIAVRVGIDGDDAVIEVRDQGPGMSEEDAARAFERFYRADPSRARESGGAGLGLAIVSAITEAHGGRAEVDTAPGEGATFRVRIPRERATPPPPPPEPEAEADDAVVDLVPEPDADPRARSV